MKSILCFGELLLRLPPANAGEWLRTNQMPVFIGGAELNVATALAKWELPVKYFTALPDNIIARDIKDYLETKNIDTSPIIYSGERVGLYYLQKGADMKGSGTVFDRNHSSFATLQTGKVNWEEVLENVAWLHFSAIPPAVSESAAALCLEALEAASKKDIVISLDLNSRSLLWKYGKEPIEVIPELAKYCNVIMGNVWAANTLLGIPVSATIHDDPTQENYLMHANESASNIFEKFPNCNWVANTFRFDANENSIEYFATLDTKESQSVSPVFKTDSVVERVGSGDCFMAGLIYGIVNESDSKEIISMAAAAAFGKLQEIGDATNNSINDIQKILKQFA